MIKLKDGNSYNVNLPTYYIEDVSELSKIPASAIAGTIVEVNAASGFRVFMKAEDGSFREL